MLARSSGTSGARRPGIDLAERQESFQKHCVTTIEAANAGGQGHEGSRRADRRHHRRRHGHGPRTRPPAGGRGLQRRDVRRLGGGDGGDQAAVRGRPPAAGPAHHHARRRRLGRGPGQALRRRGRPRPGHRQDPPAVQQCRHRRRRQHDRARPRRMGADLQHLLVRRLLLHARLPADAAQGRSRPHRQHLERQRLLGLRRPDHPAHRLQRRQVRGEGVQRGAADRPPHQRAAHQMLGRHAGPYRHLDRQELAQGPERQRLGRR